MVPSLAIAGARVILNDPAGTSPRWSDATLLGYFNDFMRALALQRGEFFTEQIEVPLVAGEMQSISKLTTLGLVDVLKNQSADYVREVDMTEMSVQARGWGKVAAKPFKVWMRQKADPFRFAVYPPVVIPPSPAPAPKATVSVTALPAAVSDATKSTDNGVSTVFQASAENFIAGRALTINTNAADTAKGVQLLSLAAALGGGQG